MNMREENNRIIESDPSPQTKEAVVNKSALDRLKRDI